MKRRQRTLICPECGSVAVIPGANGTPCTCSNCHHKGSRYSFLKGGPTYGRQWGDDYDIAGGGYRRKPKLED